MRESEPYAIHTPQGDRPSAAYWLARLQAQRGYVCTQCGHRSTTEDAFRVHVAACPEVRRAHDPDQGNPVEEQEYARG